jgi:DNA-binding transcriptional LysR family regulator
MKLNNLNLTKIRIFKEIYKERNLHKASKSLQISPSAVSQALKSLELDLGRQLFRRTKQRIIPTELAHDFFDRIIPLAHMLEGGLRDFMEENSLSLQSLAVGAPFHLDKHYLNALLKTSKKDFDVQLELDEEGIILEKLERGSFSAGFLSSKNNIAGMECTRLFAEQLVPVASQKYILDQDIRKKTKMRSLDHLGSYDLWVKWYQKNNLTFSTDSSFPLKTIEEEAVLEAVKNSVGVGLLRKSKILNLLNTGRLVELFKDRKSINHELFLYSFKDPAGLTIKEFILNIPSK